MGSDDKTDSLAISDIKITLILLLCGGLNAVNIGPERQPGWLCSDSDNSRGLLGHL
jgi:hypothetical protein